MSEPERCRDDGEGATAREQRRQAMARALGVGVAVVGHWGLFDPATGCWLSHAADLGPATFRSRTLIHVVARALERRFHWPRGRIEVRRYDGGPVTRVADREGRLNAATLAGPEARLYYFRAGSVG